MKKLLVAIKGGAGSGNYGHTGRPGLVGGSGGSGGTQKTFSRNNPPKSGDIVYHGTTGDAAKNILKSGLRKFKDPELGREPRVYFSESEEMATRYGKGALRGPDSTYAIVKFRVPGLDKANGDRIVPDEIGSPGDWGLNANVGKWAIKGVEIFDARGNLIEVLP